MLLLFIMGALAGGTTLPFMHCVFLVGPLDVVVMALDSAPAPVAPPNNLYPVMAT